MPDDDSPAFEVVNPESGHRFKVYRDGRVDGFPEGATLVINRIPVLEKLAASRTGA